jgi:ubiquitin-protein ligase
MDSIHKSYNNNNDNNKINEDRIKINREFLQNFQKGARNKRIAHECEKLYEQYPNLVLSNNSNQIEMVITEGKEKFGFIFTDTYPFRAPQIYYNGESYLDLLKIKTKFEKNMLKKYKNKECLCCESYYCIDNWSPSLTLKVVIDEIKSIVQLKKTIIKLYLVNKIKDKYLIDDIDINSYFI